MRGFLLAGLLQARGIMGRGFTILLFAMLSGLPVQVVAKVPPVSEVYRQALLVADLAGNQVESWRRRARWKAALPQLRLTFQRDLGDQFRFTSKDNVSISGGEVTIGPDKQDLVRDFDAGMRFQVTTVWYLDELVFNRDTIVVSQERRRRSEERRLILERVSHLYFQRLKLLDLLKEKSQLSDKKRREARYTIAEATAQLDALTDGWFSRFTSAEEKR